MSTANGRPLPPPAPSQQPKSEDEGNSRSTGVRPRTGRDPEISEVAGTMGASTATTGLNTQSGSGQISGAGARNLPETSGPLAAGPLAAGPLAAGIRNHSIAPESLQKPYASLAPQPKKSRSQTAPRRTATGPRPQLESVPGLEDELTNPGNTSASRTKSSRAVCKKHKIARGKNGECMLCRKEEAASGSGLGWKLMVAFIVLAVIVGAAMAGFVFLERI